MIENGEVGSKPDALLLLDQLKATWPDEHRTKLAEVLYASIPSQVRTQMFNKPEEVSREATRPADFELFQNYPNPFNPTTTIGYNLPEPSEVSLVIFDVLGRRITELATRFHQAGHHTVTWNASNIASGVYFARFTATDASGQLRYSKVNKLVLMK